MPSESLPTGSFAEARMAVIVRRLEHMIGSERVKPGSEASILGLRASLEAEPGDSEQLAQVLAFADEEQLGVCVVGGGTKLGWGNRPERLDLVVSTRGLQGFSHIDADNLSLSVRAGTTVAEARAQAQAINRVLPLDPARPAQATVGGVVATGDQGARGASYGGLRDVVLGLSAVLADGSKVKFGGRTMKNVSGYDMTKLFISSFGVLGVITDVIFRLLPRYETQALVLLPVSSLDRAEEICAHILDSYLQPLALEVVSNGLFTTLGPTSARGRRGEVDWIVPKEGPVMLAGFAGQRAAVERSVDEVKERYSDQPVAVLEDNAADSLYEALAEVGAGGRFAGRLGDDPPVRARITCPLSTVWRLARNAESDAGSSGLPIEYRIGAARGTLDLLIGQVSEPGPVGDHKQDAESVAENTSNVEAAARLTAFLADVRREVGAAEGALTVREGLARLAPGFDAWGDPGSAIQIMRRIKERFDPHKVLNPGRFVGGM